MHHSVAFCECFHLIPLISFQYLLTSAKFNINDVIYIHGIIALINRVKSERSLSFLLYLINLASSESIFTREKDNPHREESPHFKKGN